MFIKLGIIAGIIILGGMVFSNEIDVLFPSTSATVVNSLKEDVSNFGTIASESVEKRIDESVDKIVDKTSNAITDEISDIGNDISNEISDVRKSSQQTITEKISNFNPVESIQNIFTDNPHVEELTDLSTNSEQIEESIIENIIQDEPLMIHETLYLSTIQQSNDDILLQYSDSSGKTTSVNVVIRTDQKEIFSGIFFTSMFETNLNDISNEISDVRKSSQQTITEKISNFNPIESIQNIFTDNPYVEELTDSSTNSEQIEESIIENVIQDEPLMIHETLSLSTTQQSNDDIILQYFDSSGKTTSVNVIIRTDQKEIFSGIFFTSIFETNLNDISGQPYYVDMIVEHDDYGTVTSSVFNPGDSTDSKISGIFSQS